MVTNTFKSGEAETVAQVWAALATVRDPELDQPVTELGFVSAAEVDGGSVRIRLRLPTYFCAPNFAYLMVADARDAVLDVAGVSEVDVRLEDHFAATEINEGVAAAAGFEGSFPAHANGELDELRATFRRKAHLACLERACRKLIESGWHVEELAHVQLADLPDSPERASLVRRRAELGMSVEDGAHAVRRRRRRACRRRLGRRAAAVREDRAGQRGRQRRVLPGAVDDEVSGGVAVKAVRLNKYDTTPELVDVAEPVVESPLDVVVRIGGAGVCRTDLHIIEGQWEEKSGVTLPYTLGHENAGWIEAVGSAVSNVAVGDPVILHPLATCGLCRACRDGDDVHCAQSAFPGIDSDGGYAELLRTNARAVVKLDPALRPADVAALADAGLTAYHAARKAAKSLRPGDKAVLIGAGGLGHIGIQALKALSPAQLIVIDRSKGALGLAKELGAEYTVLADGDHVDAVLDLTDGNGAEAVIDFVGEGGAVADGIAVLRRAGSYYVVGYGGNLVVPTIDVISTEINFIGNLVGSYNDLAELMVLAAQGKVTLHTSTYPLADYDKALDDLDHGRVRGRAILVP